MACIPLQAEIHEGVDQIFDQNDSLTIPVRMTKMVEKLVSYLNAPTVVVLDAYFAVGPVFSACTNMLDGDLKRAVHVITRAKSNVVAYQDPPPKRSGRGAPRKYGQKLQLAKLFSQSDRFTPITIRVYGRMKTLEFYCLDLTWKPIKEKLRFVLVKDGTSRFILMCSDLTLSPENIIITYSHRFKIEVSFKVLKHLMGVFCYHFWTFSWPKRENNTESDLSKITEKTDKNNIAQTLRSIEAFVNFGCIATGLLQIMAFKAAQDIWLKYSGWLRTVTSSIPSEEIVRTVVQQEYFTNSNDFSNHQTFQIISSKITRPTGNVTAGPPG